MGSLLPSLNTSVRGDVGIVPTCVQLSFVKYSLLSEYMNTWLKIVRGMYCTCVHTMCMHMYSICGSIFSTSFDKSNEICVWFGSELSNHSTVRSTAEGVWLVALGACLGRLSRFSLASTFCVAHLSMGYSL